MREKHNLIWNILIQPKCNNICNNIIITRPGIFLLNQQARKPRSYASLKLRPTHLLTYLLTRVKCRATSVAKKEQPADTDGFVLEL